MRTTSRHVLPLPVLLLGLFLASGCTEREAGSEATATAERAAAALRLPEAKAGTLYVEGLPQPVTLRLYDAPEAPFVTYVPDSSFVGTVVSAGEGTAVRFHANFGGRENRDAYLHFFFPSPAQNLGGPSTLARQLEGAGGLLTAGGRRITHRDTTSGNQPCPWAAVRYRFTDPGRADEGSGYACIGRHDGAPFYLVARRPAAYGDGFGPRAALLLAELRWHATGESLGHQETAEGSE